MNNLILLIFTPEDMAFIPEAVTRLKGMGIDRLWVMHNPHLGLPYPETAKALDQEIAAVEREKATAIARENFESAKDYRNQGNDLRVKRDLEIKNAYKAIPEAQIQAVYERAFSAINAESTGIPAILMEAIADPLSPDQAFQYLHGQTSQWTDQFPHGEYVIAWIRALPDPQITVQKFIDTTVGVITEPASPPADEADEDQSAERKRLLNLEYAHLKIEAQKAGVKAWGKKKDVLVEEIITAHELASL